MTFYLQSLSLQVLVVKATLWLKLSVSLNSKTRKWAAVLSGRSPLSPADVISILQRAAGTSKIQQMERDGTASNFVADDWKQARLKDWPMVEE